MKTKRFCSVSTTDINREEPGSDERNRHKRKGQLEIETSGLEPDLQEQPGIILEAP